ncbi:alanine dehydrogenase [bacterium]|nr:alanine dehydrogenase [bacterium]
MHFGIVADQNPLEHRVVLSPYGVEELVARGHQVTVEKGAGERARFSDADYQRCGATTAYSREEAWIRPDILLRLKPPVPEEVELMRDGQIFAGYIELPQITRQLREKYTKHNLTILALEEMLDERGRWPLLAPLSMICGRMLPQIAARYLETFEGGRGKLIMGVPGVAPCNISIIGAGLLGTTATQLFQAMGARVTILDRDHHQLERLASMSTGHLATLSASPGNINRVVRGSDVLILAIHSESGVCDKIIRREHLKTMDSRSLIIDASITQSGAAETSRPTDLRNPTYIVDDVVHYCVPNITATVARTASRAVASALVPYLLRFAEQPVDQALATYKEFDTGLICVEGSMRRKYEYLADNEE